MQGRLLAVFGTSALLVSLAVPSGLVAADQLPLPLKSDGVEAALDDAKRAVDSTTRSEGAERGKGAERPRLATGRSRLAASAGGSAVGIHDTTPNPPDYEYRPRTITVSVGDTVTWTNFSGAPHDAMGFDGTSYTPILNEGQSDSYTFSQPGTFEYFCSVHPPDGAPQWQDFTGTVKVVSSGGSGGGTGGGGGGGSSTGQGSSTGSGDNLTGPGSESAAGESAGAAGSDSRLPATGQSELPLLIAGAALLALGALARRVRGLRSPS